MLTEQGARELVEAFLADTAKKIEGGLLIYPPDEKPYGWVYSYTSRLYAETGDFRYAIGGNGPIVVERATGKLHTLGTANHPDISVAQFEKEQGFA
jgi:hypothetical protein